MWTCQDSKIFAKAFIGCFPSVLRWQVCGKCVFAICYDILICYGTSRLDKTNCQKIAKLVSFFAIRNVLSEAALRRRKKRWRSRSLGCWGRNMR